MQASDVQSRRFPLLLHLDLELLFLVHLVEITVEVPYCHSLPEVAMRTFLVFSHLSVVFHFVPENCRLLSGQVALNGRRLALQELPLPHHLRSPRLTVAAA